MASDRISIKIFSGFLSSADTVVEEGRPLIIDGVVINNQNGYFGKFFKMTNTKGDTILDLYLPAGETVTYYNSFLADFGVIIKAGHDLMSYSIFYKVSG